jgi:hypothetical protein
MKETIGGIMISYYLDVLIELLAELGHFTAKAVDKLLMFIFNVKQPEELFLTMVEWVENNYTR